MSILPRLPKDDGQKRSELRRQLIRRYAVVGGQLFGAVPKNRVRQFFCLDRHTWIWHEEWTDASGKRQVMTTRYLVRPDGVLKQQDGQTYRPVSRQEARNLYRGAQLYYQQVETDYRRLLQTV